ncbi:MULTISPECIES: heavy-metal-associated domain-containing protein [unclassified Dysgonomonas]|uniref:heavy-metal-associated domain-containing protein n=1 Tax=unclassified Dysgonomonas TaxID=2630389 RepID=UPI0013EA1834|nr:MULTISPECIES: heavy metal-associated domain-containing protein [unclassified Dysgonomonas]
MNIKIFSLVLTLLLTIGGVSFAQDKKNKKDDKEIVLFDVSMHCDNCKKRIEKNIAYEKGVTDMSVDLPNKTVEIEYKKDKTSVEKLQTAIEKLGYEVTVHNNEETE